MDVFSELLQIFTDDEVEVKERREILECSFTTTKERIAVWDSLIRTLEKFPERDSVRLTLLSLTDEVIIIDNIDYLTVETEYIEYINELEVTEDVNVSIDIKKSIFNSVFSVYRSVDFLTDLVKTSLLDMMKFFSDILMDRNHIVFEMMDNDSIFITKSIVMRGSESTVVKEINRCQKIIQCKTTGNFMNIVEYALLPDDFDIISSSEEHPLRGKFQLIRTILSSIYIANNSYLNGNDLMISITGHRSGSYSYDLSNQMSLKSNCELHKIYEWIYTDGNAVDKAIIARNIISLHCRYSDLLDIDHRTFLSIRSNYEIYQKDSVETYLELKNKMANFIVEEISKFNDISMNFLTKFKSNIIALFTFIISIFLGNIFSASKLDNIFTKDITTVSYVVLVGSLVFLSISIYELNYSIKRLEIGYESLKDNYEDTIDAEDFKNVFKDDEVFKKGKSEVKSKRTQLIVLWFLFIIICFLMIDYLSDFSEVLFKTLSQEVSYN